MAPAPTILPVLHDRNDGGSDQPRLRAGTIFITGATGFIGRHLLRRLDPAICREALCLTRKPLTTGTANNPVRVTAVPGDLLNPAFFADHLRAADTVVHLAAATGNKSRDELFHTNATATQQLLEACEDAGVRRFLFVSTIAVKYTDSAGYHYAESKRAAEVAVNAARIPHTIVRPGIVLGPGSAGWEGLAKLAGLPLVPLFGPGTHLTQPIDVNDLVDCLLDVLARDKFDSDTIELGGPDQISVRDLLRTIALRTKSREPRFLRMPMGIVRSSLALAEPLLRPVMPLTRGQLCVFHNDSTITNNDIVRHRHPGMKDLPAMIDASVVAPSASTDRREISLDDNLLERECATLTCYLTGSAPTDYVRARYRHAHRASDGVRCRPSPFDRVLLRLAAVHPLVAQLTDIYARIFAPRSLFRRKAVLLLAILESTAPSHLAFDHPDTASQTGFWLRLALRGALVAIIALLGLLILGPLHLILRVLSAANAGGKS